MAQVQQEIIISAGEDLEKLLSQAQKKHPALKWQNNKQLTQEELLIQVAEGKFLTPSPIVLMWLRHNKFALT